MAYDGEEDSDQQKTTLSEPVEMAPRASTQSFDDTTADCGNDDDVSNERTEKAQMKSEFYRVRSFRVKRWPRKDIETAPLARTGLYYSGSGDAVLCAFCPISLAEWKKEDVPAERHHQQNPNCPFLKGDNVGNIPLTLPQSSRTPVQSPSSSNQYVGIVHPRFPDLSMYEARLATFENWPADAKQKPEDLAMAGFFYMGTGDKVKCFFCEKKLIKWHRSDDPWLEHIKHSPNCQFVLMNKGSEFVRDVLNSYHLQWTQPPRPHPVQGASPQHVPSTAPPLQPVDDQVTATMHRPPLRRILSMGYPYDDVKVLVQRVMMEKGEENPSMEYLLTLLLRMEERGFTCRDVPLDGQYVAVPAYRSPQHRPPANGSPRHMPVPSSWDKGICKLCQGAEVQLTFQPCGHLVCCAQCGALLTECPACHQRIRSSIRTYLT